MHAYTHTHTHTRARAHARTRARARGQVGAAVDRSDGIPYVQLKTLRNRVSPGRLIYHRSNSTSISVVSPSGGSLPTIGHLLWSPDGMATMQKDEWNHVVGRAACEQGCPLQPSSICAHFRGAAPTHVNLFTRFLTHDTEQWVERVFQFYERYIRKNNQEKKRETTPLNSANTKHGRSAHASTHST